jgi:hypothetical protein
VLALFRVHIFIQRERARPTHSRCEVLDGATLAVNASDNRSEFVEHAALVQTLCDRPHQLVRREAYMGASLAASCCARQPAIMRWGTAALLVLVLAAVASAGE